jgi:LysM repeat protein
MRAHRSLTTATAIATLAFLALLGTGTHTVTPGETLAGIAARYGTTTAALASANGIANPNRIFAGARLSVPGTGGAPAAAGSYTVRSGDTLGSIASRAGSSIAALVSLNGIKNANLIRTGQVLHLPGATTAASSAPAASTAPAGGASYHVVAAGETISGIAARYGISQAQLIAANGLTGGIVYTGQRLSLVAAPTSAPAATAATYTVRSGDTLSGIAQRFGTTLRALQSANGISNPDRVLVGMRLDVPSTSGGSSGLQCPVPGTHFMNDWGFPRSGGRFHEGNDLFAPRGTAAVAVVSGTVVQTTGTIGGHQVKLLGDDGATYYYTHLDRFGASGRVGAGQVVGYVGNTGNAAGGPTHVHFEVHPGAGAAVNPYPRISGVC